VHLLAAGSDRRIGRNLHRPPPPPDDAHLTRRARRRRARPCGRGPGVRSIPGYLSAIGATSAPARPPAVPTGLQRRPP